jgi:hypothetical protein
VEVYILVDALQGEGPAVSRSKAESIALTLHMYGIWTGLGGLLLGWLIWG